MSLIPSLLQAVVNLDGDALVMHVGEKPYVVSPTGQVDLSARGLSFDAVWGILTQLMPPQSQAALDEFGAAQFEMAPMPPFENERFAVVASRGGDDVWVELRRRRADPPADRLAAAEPSAASVSTSATERLAAPAPGAPARLAAPFDDPARPACEPAAAPPATIAEALASPVVATPARATNVDGAQQTFTIEHTSYQAQEIEIDLDAAANVESEPPPSAPAARPTATPDIAAPPIFAAMAAAPTPAQPSAVQSPDTWETIDLAAEGGPAFDASEPIERSATLSSWDARAIALSPSWSVSSPEPASAETSVEPPPEPVQPRPAVAAAPEATPTILARVGSAAALESPAAIPPITAMPPIAPVPPIAIVPAAVPPIAAVPTYSAPTYGMPSAVEPPLPRLAQSPIVAAFPTPRPSAQSYSVASGDEAPLSQPAVVLPLTRNPIRHEVPPALGEEAVSTLDRLLRLAAARGAAALYLSSNARPSLRVDGEMQLVDGPILGPNEVESLLMTLMPERNAEALRTGSATEWIIDLPELGRVRCMSFRDHRGPGGVLRMMPVRAVSAEQLALSREIQALAMEPEGLVIVAGPRSGGKRTLIAALIDLINRGRRDHVITVEREINIVHERVGSLVSQRESRGGLPAMLELAQAALREDPDVLVLEEVRSAALMNVALDAAAAGQLIIGGLPAHSASDAIDRIIDLYPPEQRRQVQLALAQNLHGVIGQVLLRKSGGGRIAARELLLNTPAVASVLAEGKTSQLPLAIEGGRKHGMAPLNDSLVGLVQSGIVTASEAYRHASDRASFVALLNRQGIDTSFVRLA
jgi:twitching motility protein PilT